MIESLLHDRLKTKAEHVYPNVAPAKYSTPCVVYQRIGTETFNALDGYTDQGFVTFQFSISSPVFGQAKMLARAIRNDLREWESEDVTSVSWIDEVVGVDNSTDVALHRVLLFFKFFTNSA